MYRMKKDANALDANFLKIFVCHRRNFVRSFFVRVRRTYLSLYAGHGQCPAKGQGPVYIDYNICNVYAA